MTIAEHHRITLPDVFTLQTQRAGDLDWELSITINRDGDVNEEVRRLHQQLRPDSGGSRMEPPRGRPELAVREDPPTGERSRQPLTTQVEASAANGPPRRQHHHRPTTDRRDLTP